MDDSKDVKEKNTNSPRKRILETRNELKKALDAWEDLSQEPQGLSADQQMLNDVKDLLKQLQNKIEEFK
ncbi:MAG: hypothetical protein ACAH59_00710 [Pseudobdellovibrionaceae bacterium]